MNEGMCYGNAYYGVFEFKNWLQIDIML
jgi:hypothetical protein